MFKIAEFSKICQVSAKALRYYDQIDLLKPSYTDPDTGYRYYAADQLLKVHQIAVFKDLGFTLEQMIPLLNGGVRPEELRSLLLHKSAAIRNLLETERARLSRIEARLAEMERPEDGAPMDVVMRRAEPERIASIRERCSKAAIPRLAKELAQFAKRCGESAPQKLIVLWHSCAECEDDVDLEAAIPWSSPAGGDERIRVRELEGALMASIVHPYGPQGLYEVNARLAFWLQENGYRIPDDAPSREIYWELPSEGEAPRVAEIQMPIAAVPGRPPEGGGAP